MLQSLAAFLFAPRPEKVSTHGKKGPTASFAMEPGDWAVSLLYAAVLAWRVPHHRPWIDEAQAWMVARSTSVHDLLLRRLHYEGAPALWHLLLKAAIGLGLPYAGLNWMGAAFALAGIVVLLRFSPFPRVFRWLLPFTFALQYQYAVLARPYVLFPLLLFTLCALFGQRQPRPLVFAIVAGLIANVNAHTAVLSCVFAALYLLHLQRLGVLTTPAGRRSTALATAVFCLFCVASIAVAFPAPDAMVVPSATGKVKPGNAALRRWLPPEQLPPGAPPLDAPLVSTTPTPSPATSAALPGAMPPPSAPSISKSAEDVQGSSPSTAKPSLLTRARGKLQHTTLTIASLLTFPIAESNVLALLWLAAFVLWLWFRRSLRFLLPWAVAVPFAALVWVYDHHTWIFLMALVAAAWLALTTGIPKPHTPRWVPPAFAALSLAVLVLQIGWTAHALWLEAHFPYDPGEEAEAFLASHYAGRRVDAFGFETVALQPYAQHNLFANWDHPYWMWSNANAIDLRRSEALQQPPDLVVIADPTEEADTLANQWRFTQAVESRPNQPMVQFWESHGYQLTQRFCGERPTRAGVDDALCDDILVRTPGGSQP